MEGALKFAASKIIAAGAGIYFRILRAHHAGDGNRFSLSAITSIELSKNSIFTIQKFYCFVFFGGGQLFLKPNWHQKRASVRLIPASRNWSHRQYYLSAHSDAVNLFCSHSGESLISIFSIFTAT